VHAQLLDVASVWFWWILIEELRACRPGRPLPADGAHCRWAVSVLGLLGAALKRLPPSVALGAN